MTCSVALHYSNLQIFLNSQKRLECSTGQQAETRGLMGQGAPGVYLQNVTERDIEQPQNDAKQP